MSFRKVNNLTGWALFTFSFVIYLITVEDTASYWDCGEFIADSYKLMVPHPPGAPLFLLIGRLFSFLSFGNTGNVAYWVNVSSALSSAFTILFLFWTISMLTRKILGLSPDHKVSISNTWLVIGSSAIGALAYTFSDSFWFSAVEAEVYAMSSFFTAIVVWAMLKWELIKDESRANRWLILIAFMMGLSIGVHLLNLVTIPALGLIYYFKKYKPTFPGIIATMAISASIIILINNIIIPGLPGVARSFEVFFVNTLGLPFGSGALFFAIVVLVALVFSIRYSIKHQKVKLNTILLGLTFILIGYSSYALIVIRSNFDTPIDQNNPENAITFVKYLKREQYGSRPLLYGKYYSADFKRDSNGNPISEKGAPIYTKGKDANEIIGRKEEYKYDPKQSTILPRMYSEAPAHVRKYMEVTGLRRGEKPTFLDNMHCMFSHQIGTMYMRYFFWNFTGRESDVQNAGVLWPTESRKEVPSKISQNKGRNNYWALPLVLGLVGLIFQLYKDRKGFSFVALLFFLTGIALILYLNSPPIEPRERDYIYVGSYYAFAIWIGFGVLGIAYGLRKVLNPKTAAITATVLSITVPGIMAQQNWDDHDRSDRFFSVDIARNFLSSTAKDSILFTGGDNDTFPLWYVQDVESFRTDSRVVVLSYFNTDWYIEQMMRKVYQSDPFPFSLTLKNYQTGGPNDYLPYVDMGIKSIDLRQFLDLLRNDDKRLRLYPSANVLPSKVLTLDINKEKVKALGIIPRDRENEIVDRMVLRLKDGSNNIVKNDLAILDILATNDWSRPIYLNNTSMAQINIDLGPYAIQEGAAFRILPIKNPEPDQEFVNTDIMYDNLMSKFQFRNLDDPDVYYSEDYRRFVLNHRSYFNTLATALIKEGDMDRAKEALNYSLEKMPDKGVPYDYTNARTVALLYMTGENVKASEISHVLGERAMEMVKYIIEGGNDTGFDLQENVLVLNQLQRIESAQGNTTSSNRYKKVFEKGMEYYNTRL